MKKHILLLLTALATLVPAWARDNVALPDSITASEAFIKMPAQTLDLLSESMRKDMLDYMQVDSVYQVRNAMEGLSWLLPPVKKDFIRVHITPVTELTLRVLPCKKSEVVVSVYTIGDSVTAGDSDIRFYNTAMQELKRDKYIKIADSKDFLKLKGMDSQLKKELLALLPFPTVRYDLSADGSELKAILTVGKYMGKEDMAKIEPYLNRERLYHWTGSRYELTPTSD